MPKTLKLKLSDDNHEMLQKISAQTGRSPEDLVLGWIRMSVRELDDDPLLQLAGVFTCDRSDLSERHNHHIGAAIHSDNR